VIFVHNHPVESSPEANYHFSHTDFKSLLGSPTEQFSPRHFLLGRFTQEVCKEMHIVLYKIEHSDNDGIARHVESE
jgi:hypothetical protein